MHFGLTNPERQETRGGTFVPSGATTREAARRSPGGGRYEAPAAAATHSEEP